MESGLRVLIVGGGGFIGRRVVRRLLEEGHEPSIFDAQAPQSIAPTAITGDITRMEDLWEAFQTARPEVVVQLAYLLGPETTQRPFLAMRVNVDGMTNVFEAARLFGSRRVVYASSVVVHGLQEEAGDDPVTEESPLRPANAYGIMKRFNEEMAGIYRQRYGVEMVGARLSNVFGHGRVTGSSGPWAGNIVSMPALGKRAEIPVSPHFRTSMINVEDVAEYITRLAIHDGELAPVYLTGGYELTVGELAIVVRDTLGGAEIDFTGDMADPGKAVPVYAVNSSRIIAATGYEMPTLVTRIQTHAEEARGTQVAV